MCLRGNCRVKGRKCMWQHNQDIIENDLKSIQVLLTDKGISPIKKLILIKNLAAKHIANRNRQQKEMLLEKIGLLCDTSVMSISKDEVNDLREWIEENEVIDIDFTSSLNNP